MSSVFSLNDLPAPPAGRTGWPWTGPEAEPPRPQGEAAAWPRITIVTPSYNQGRFLEETIRSVLLQGYSNLEYIITDGGSTDESVEIIRKYEPWLDYWVSEKDRGQSHAINKGFARANGDLLAWLNSDDIYLPGALAAVATCPERQADVALIYGRAFCMDQDSVLSGDVLALPFDFQTLLSDSNFVPQASAFFRSSSFAEVGGLNEALHFCMDYDLWLNLAGCGRAVFLPRPLSGMRQYPETKTGSADRRMFVEVRQMIERHGGHGIPLRFERWLLGTRVPKAFEAFRQGDAEAGRDELGYVVRNVPAWQATSEPIIKEIVWHAWQQASGLADDDQPVLDYATLVCSHLPAELAAHGLVRRQTFARLEERLAARNDQLGHFAAARRYVWRAFRDDPHLIGKRWLWGTIVRPVMPSTARTPGSNSRRPGPDLKRRLLAGLPVPWPNEPASSSSLNTCGLAAIVGLLDGWDLVEPRARSAWTNALRAAQDKTTGLFVESPQLSSDMPVSADRQAHEDWLTTYLALGALDVLGADLCQPPVFIEPFKSAGAVEEWLSGLDWAAPEWSTSLDWSDPYMSNSAQIMFLLSFLFRQGNRTAEPGCEAAARAIFDWLDDRQDPVSGFWWMSRGKHRIVSTILAGHFAPMYACFGRPLKHVSSLVDTAISVQQPGGLFSLTSAPTPCTTQTAVELLVRLSLLTNYRAAAVKVSLAHAFRAVAGQLEAQIASLSAQPVGWERVQTSELAIRPASQWLSNSLLAAIWLNLLTLGLISQRYPGDFPDGLQWQLPRPPMSGWGWPNRPPSTSSRS